MVQLTELMQRAGEGDKDAEAELLSAVYDDLRRQAAHYMRRQPRHHSLWVTDVVHGAYARLFGGAPSRWTDRRHFFRVAAKAMEHLLVDHARARNRAKRSAPGDRVPLDDLRDEFERAIPDQVADILDVHDALNALEAVSERSATIARLRFFAHLSVERTASTTGIPLRTVEREWAYAKGWLSDWLRKHGRGN